MNSLSLVAAIIMSVMACIELYFSFYRKADVRVVYYAFAATWFSWVSAIWESFCG